LFQKLIVETILSKQFFDVYFLFQKLIVETIFHCLFFVMKHGKILPNRVGVEQLFDVVVFIFQTN